ncbi:MAG TPA: sigma 54-interacting transcriptional regulator [Pyrinomonadaceae bacterium]|jgi:transcriptional regulator with GAF, ATPase, and Fis domain|nr:sigma 54-interacting transcriptional regulator [Pyrinomonadaceae bacterium]
MADIEQIKSLSFDRKFKMQEAREAIIERLARDLPTNIDLERFLNVVVSEIGRMFDADRCDLLQLIEGKELKISHEWRRSDAVPSSLGTQLPIDAARLSERLDLKRPIIINDTSRASDPTLRFFAKALETRSLLITPIIINDQPASLIGLHDTQKAREWLEEEVQFLESIARQLAIGYQYTRLFTAQQDESRRTRALLEIANTLNSHSDFTEVSDKALEKAINLVGADYGALGVLDENGEKISLVSFKAAEGRQPGTLIKLVESHGKSLRVSSFKPVAELIRDGKTLALTDNQLPLAGRIIFNKTLGGRAALVAPVRVGGQPFGLVGFVWSSEVANDENTVALVEGIADQIGTALERDQLSAEVIRLKSQLVQRQSEIVGQSVAIRRAIDLALTVSDASTTVLIQGESGTGKELLANLIHYNSDRSSRTFVKINCGAIPESLLESELFGHERGAFTDARTRRIGRFEEADGGTLFLDEIGEMSLQAQVRLLRVLQDGEFTRVGGSDVIKTDVRVIAASNVDLEKAVEEGKFRRDLYFRLSAFPIIVPPLRERREDVPLLVIHFLERFKEKTGRYISGISKDAMKALMAYDWPGNVRELENAIERAVIVAAGRKIEAGDLPESIVRGSMELRASERERRLSAAKDGSPIGLELELPISLDEAEKILIEATLDYTAGDKSQAARILNIGRKTLYRKIAEYGISDIKN